MELSREKDDSKNSSLIDILWLNRILSCLSIELDPRSPLLLIFNLRLAFLWKEYSHLIKTPSLLPSQVGSFKNPGSRENIYNEYSGAA